MNDKKLPRPNMAQATAIAMRYLDASKLRAHADHRCLRWDTAEYPPAEFSPAEGEACLDWIDDVGAIVFDNTIFVAPVPMVRVSIFGDQIVQGWMVYTYSSTPTGYGDHDIDLLVLNTFQRLDLAIVSALQELLAVDLQGVSDSLLAEQLEREAAQ